MTIRSLLASLLAACCAAAIGALALWQTKQVGVASAATAAQGGPAYRNAWNRQDAADYLDSREVWWQGWAPAQKDHATLCISCHTSVPYALARPLLRRDAGETEMATPEKIMMASVEKRVEHWTEVAPFYSDEMNGVGKTAESHATEAVLNATLLTNYDTADGHLRAVTRTALDEAWALQEESGELAGGWKWQDFHLAPWESVDSSYQGAALLALEVGGAPDGYAEELAVQAPMDRLRRYLRRRYAAQPLLNRLYVLWASTKVPGLLSTEEQAALVAKVRGLQQTDGGWRVAELETWKRSDGTGAAVESDGYATGLVVLVFDAAGIGRQDETVKRGLAWLEQHQEKGGEWRTGSLNKRRDPESNIGRFMSDAATGYAVLALDKAM
jgi:squalene-hopene/tetraprenyl-beta-curcumene cyclase